MVSPALTDDGRQPAPLQPTAESAADPENTLEQDGETSPADNERVQHGDPIAHGEISALRAAGRQKTYRDTTLYTTLAPCAMCTGTIIQFEIPRVVVGEARTFDGEF